MKWQVIADKRQNLSLWNKHIWFTGNTRESLKKKAREWKKLFAKTHIRKNFYQKILGIYKT